MSDTMLAYMDQPQEYYPLSEIVNSTNLSSKSCISPSFPRAASKSGQLRPRKSISEPVQRRRRISRDTTVTLVNATAANFRILVNQYTGYHNLGACKGPIYLNFSIDSKLDEPCATISKGSKGYGGNFQQPNINGPYHNHEVETAFPILESNYIASDGYYPGCLAPYPAIEDYNEFLLEDDEVTCLYDL